MEKTESTIIQVAPSYENAKIKEMENFGWSLASRQEIHEEGDAYGSPAVFSDSYVIKTKVSHYVKLHFSRSLSLPNLDKIKQIESDYMALPFPGLPTTKSFLWPVGCILLGLFGFSQGSDMIAGSVILLALGGFWLYMKIQKRQKNLAICMQSLERQKELVNQLKSIV